ncbi:GreA/GreB family elongation factor [Neobacillus sp. OS1-32]|jgi:transcription elongation factor GreA|uniref:GreA/GreB family elongation factor n=1 Tax=Neobacillus paridis TaxID=2803862 RepID=A0ABS1TRQ9_9BACI|nr:MULTISPECIES: GreA/GreB family elongation factor [Neobacillus]MBL4953957.1 GreA/GreB family elongation factor [Neobacillus paridis]WML31053.1 GreA/GreB family elongation factor [Neobacillus sp. OS1-32]
MNHSTLQNKDFFSEQLAYIEENIKDLTNLYISSTPIQERLKHFFNLYVLEVEELLNQNRKNAVISFFSKVYIGTKVTVQYDDEDDFEEYVICFPEQSDPDRGFISFLSPVGRQLLLKEMGEKISLKVPTGKLQVTIKEISYVGNLFEMKRRTKEA